MRQSSGTALQNYGEFAIIKSQPGIDSGKTGVHLVPAAATEEFLVVRQDALFESGFDQFIKQLPRPRLKP